jgi:MoaA/NifB/PqqE/SkfB family radical SAM enzyme
MKFIKGFQGPVKISLTGGEPLIRYDVLNILSNLRLCKPGTDINVFSSGVMVKNGLIESISEEYAINLKDAGLKSIYITLFHGRAVYHDKMADCRWAFEISKKSIENLINVGIETKVHLVLNRFNVDCIHTVLSELSKLKIKEVRLLKLVKHGRATSNWERIGVSYQKQNELFSDLIMKRNQFPLRMTFSGFPEMTPCRPLEWAKGCQAGTRLFFVDFNGEVFPCACTRGNSKVWIGHISDEVLCSRLWHNNHKEFRDFCLSSL